MLYTVYWYTYRRKIFWGSRIWPYFVKKVGPKNQKKWVFSRYIRYSTFRCALKNRQFWPLLTNFSGKIRSDSKSSAFFTSICIAPNIFSAFILCFPERYEFALDVLFTHRLVLVALYNQWNKWCRQFANIHIDVKFFEEAESGLILSKNMA